MIDLSKVKIETSKGEGGVTIYSASLQVATEAVVVPEHYLTYSDKEQADGHIKKQLIRDMWSYIFGDIKEAVLKMHYEGVYGIQNMDRHEKFESAFAEVMDKLNQPS